MSSSNPIERYIARLPVGSCLIVYIQHPKGAGARFKEIVHGYHYFMDARYEFFPVEDNPSKGILVVGGLVESKITNLAHSLRGEMGVERVEKREVS